MYNNWNGPPMPPWTFMQPPVKAAITLEDAMEAKRAWDGIARELREQIEKDKPKDKKEDDKKVLPIWLKLGLWSPVIIICYNLLTVGGVVLIINMVKSIH